MPFKVVATPFGRNVEAAFPHESEALAALITACVLQAARDVDEGVPFTPPARRVIEENVWRAIRHGLDGQLLDLTAPRIEPFPAAEALDRLRAWSGADVSLPELNGAQRQRRMIEAGATPFEVFEKCVEETRATYPPKEPVP